MTRKSYSRWVILSAIMMGSFLGPLMGTIVNIALPSIADEFQTDLTTTGWVNLCFILVTSVTVLTFSRMGDMWGHRKILLWGQFIFILATIFCGMANSFDLLIIARSLQAIGSSMAISVSGAIIVATFPPRERGRALGTYGITIAVGLILGPSLGGIIIQYLSWHWVFFITAPMAIIAFVYGYMVLPLADKVSKQKFDIPGAIFASIGLCSLMLALTNGNHWGWTSLVIAALAVLTIISVIIFIMWEKRFPYPMIPLSIFRNTTFTAGNVAAATCFTAEFAALILMPFYLINIMQKRPEDAGLILAASPVVSLVVAPLSGWLSDKMGTRILSFVGMLIVALSMVLFTTLTPITAVGQIIIFLVIFGIGTSVFQSPNSSAVMGCVEKSCLGVGNGILATTRNIGMAMGIALSTMLAEIGQEDYFKLNEPTTGTNVALMSGLHLAFWVAAAIAMLGSILALLRGEPPAIQEEQKVTNQSS